MFSTTHFFVVLAVVAIATVLAVVLLRSRQEARYVAVVIILTLGFMAVIVSGFGSPAPAPSATQARAAAQRLAVTSAILAVANHKPSLISYLNQSSQAVSASNVATQLTLSRSSTRSVYYTVSVYYNNGGNYSPNYRSECLVLSPTSLHYRVTSGACRYGALVSPKF